MKKNLFILLLFVIASCKNKCEKFTENYTPKNLEEVFSSFDCNWPEDFKTNFKNKQEDSLIIFHFGLGRNIRNKWSLWRSNNELSSYFNNKGLFHPDDISTVIIKSYHRKLNNKPLNLEKQVKYYKDYWENSKIENDSIEYNDTDF